MGMRHGIAALWNGPPRRGPERGHTLIEVIIVAGLAGAIALVTTGASDTITTAAKYGSGKLDVDAEAQEILHFIANDLQNASSDSDPITLVPRFSVVPDAPVEELLPRTAYDQATDGEDTRVVTGTEELGSRPRLATITVNSRFRFQKVVGMDVDPGLGEVDPRWSEPIEYYVLDRRLIREQGGRRRAIGTNVTAFRVVAEAQANFRVFLKIQKRNPSTGEVHSAAGMIEVNPKNR